MKSLSTMCSLGSPHHTHIVLLFLPVLLSGYSTFPPSAPIPVVVASVAAETDAGTVVVGVERKRKVSQKMIHVVTAVAPPVAATAVPVATAGAPAAQ